MHIDPYVPVFLCHLPGRAGPASFKSDPYGLMEESFLLEFVAESVSPIVEFTVRFTERGEVIFKKYISKNMGGKVFYFSFKDDWQEVQSRPTSNGEHFFSSRVELEGLSPGTVYEVRNSFDFP